MFLIAVKKEKRGRRMLSHSGMYDTFSDFNEGISRRSRWEMRVAYPHHHSFNGETLHSIVCLGHVFATGGSKNFKSNIGTDTRYYYNLRRA